MAERGGDGAPRTAARAFWSGTITFGLVSIPVELMTATRPSQLPLRMLAPDGQPLRRRYFCPEEERALAPEEIARGYEVATGVFVLVADEELEALAPQKSRDIALQRFVGKGEIDPLFFERGYFLAPSGVSGRAYHLLAEIIEESGRSGIATFVMRGTEHLIAIRAEGGILRGEILRFVDEIRSPDEAGLPEPKKPTRARVEALEREIERLSGPLDAGELRDTTTASLVALAEEKRRRGQDLFEAAAPEEELEGEVVDLMQLLKQRLGAEP